MNAMRRLLPFLSAFLALLTLWSGTVAQASEREMPEAAASAHFDDKLILLLQPTAR